MRNVVLNHISSIGCCNPLGQTNPMLDSTTMLDNGNFGFPYSFLPRFPPYSFFYAPAFSTPAFSVAQLKLVFTQRVICYQAARVRYLNK